MTLLKKKQPVLFAGENHLISLYYPQSSKQIISISCWNCSYSDHGIGSTLCVAIDPEYASKMGISNQLVLADNLNLATMIVKHFNQYFEGFNGFASVSPQKASFQKTVSTKHYSISCSAAEIKFELIWLEAMKPALEIFLNTSGPISYDVSAVIASCKQAQILINDAAVSGEVHMPDGLSQSSAFLAFSETWAAA